MKLAKQIFIQIIFCLGIAGVVQSQNLTVTPLSLLGLQPEDIILNTFLGEGVEVLDITYGGEPISIGIFKDGQGQIGIDKGIIITSGDADLADNINDGAGTGAPSSGPSTDFNLEGLTTANLNDLSYFEIEFIPTADSLQFKYVFASDEYPEYACSSFNDVFGFFITGPNPMGGTYNAQNIALIPGTNLPVTINNVNPGVVGGAGNITNCTPPLGTLAHAEFYNDNPMGTENLTYDGYLDVFIAEAVVVPCETYKMKIAIADVSDGAYDSGVFLEAKSFKTNTIIVEAATVSLDGTITEGCADGLLKFRLPEVTTDDFIIDLNIFGTATNGVDYVEIPDTIIIPSGSQEIEIPVMAFDDGLIELDESIAIDIQRDICNRDTFYFFIRDNELLAPEIGNDTIICEGDTLAFDATLPILLPPPPSFTSGPKYVDSTNKANFSEIQVFGVQPTVLHLEAIQSICIDSFVHPWIGDIDLYLLTPGGQLLELSTDNGGSGGNGGQLDYYVDMCFTVDALPEVHYGEEKNGALPAFLPFTGNFQPEGDWEDIVDGIFPTNGTWKLLMLDDTPGFNGTLRSWTITFEPAYKLFYEWFPKEGLSCYDCPNPMAFPDTTTTYEVVATDIYGCEVSDSITVTVYETIPAPEVTCVEDIFEITFNWDSIPGIPLYEVNIGGTWINPNNGNFSHIVSGLDLDSTVNIQVRAISDCGAEIADITCATPPCAIPTVTLVNGSIQNVDCFGGSNGSFEADGSGQFPPISYDIGFGPQPTGLFTSLEAGTYMLSVTDDQDCFVEMEVIISEPDSLILSDVWIEDISCFGANDGQGTVEIVGGTGPFVFDWSNGNVDSIANDLVEGLNNVIVTDANGCTATASINILSPIELTVQTDGKDADCFESEDGWVTVIPIGGTGPYNFIWDDNLGQTTDTAFNLKAGTYNVTVTDINDCLAFGSVNIVEPDQIIIQEDMQKPCTGSDNGIITVIPQGGVSPYDYEWLGFAETTSTLANVPSGKYTVIVTDANDCTETLVVDLEESPAITWTIELIDQTCKGANDGMITVDAQGGEGNLTYSWDSGPTMNSINLLAAGQYCLTVTDENNCSIDSCFTITDPDGIVIEGTVKNALCSDDPSGAIDVLISNAEEPIDYNWSGPAAFVSNDDNIDKLLAGTYSLTVTDNKGCSTIEQFEVSQPLPLLTSLTRIETSCFGTADGQATAVVQGGNSPYSYEWSNGANESTASGLPAGIVSVTITDANNCKTEDQIEILEPAKLEASIEVEIPTCFEGSDGEIHIDAVGGNSPYSYSTNGINFNASDIQLGLKAGVYELTIKDQNGCKLIISDIGIDEPDPVVIDLGENIEVKKGESTTLMDILGTSPDLLNFIWSSPDTTSIDCANCATTLVTPESSTWYSLIVEDINGCRGEDGVYVNVITEFVIKVADIFTPNGDGVNDVLPVHGSPEMEILTYEIYNRWGDKVYHIENIDPNDNASGWNGEFKGKKAESGVYAWVVKARFPDGHSDYFSGQTTLLNK